MYHPTDWPLNVVLPSHGLTPKCGWCHPMGWPISVGGAIPWTDPWMWVVPFHRLWSWTESKDEMELSTSTYWSLLPDCGCSVTSYLLLPPSHLLHQGGLHPQTVCQKKSLLPEGVFVRHFVAATRQVTTHSYLTELAGWKLAWSELVKRRG